MPLSSPKDLKPNIIIDTIGMEEKKRKPVTIIIKNTVDADGVFSNSKSLRFRNKFIFPFQDKINQL